MKKKIILIIVLCASFFMSSCSLNNHQVIKNYNKPKALNIKYDNYITKYEKPSEKLNKLVNQYITASNDDVTRLAFELEESQIMYIDYYNDRLFYDDNHRKVYKYFKDEFSKEAIEKIDDIRFKDLMIEILNSNYILEKTDGSYSVVIDYDSYKKYYSSMNTEGRSYFYIKEREVEKPYMLEGEFNIDLYELGDRIVETDDFILKYPFSKRINEMLSLNTNRVWAILIGDEISKVVDENSIVKGNYRTLYRYLSSRISNKGFNRFLVGYINLLEKQEYRFDEIANLYINTYDDFYNYDIPMCESERIIVKYLDGNKMGGNYNYPKIVGYSNEEAQERFNKALLGIVEEKINYEPNKGHYTGKVDFWSNYKLSYNRDDVSCFNIFIDYVYEETGKAEYIIRGLTIDFSSGKILNISDILPELENENDLILSRIYNYLEYNDDKNLVDINDFDRLENFDYILNDTYIEILYDVFNKDNNFVKTIKIPISFDGLTVKINN